MIETEMTPPQCKHDGECIRCGKCNNYLQITIAFNKKYPYNQSQFKTNSNGGTVFMARMNRDEVYKRIIKFLSNKPEGRTATQVTRACNDGDCTDGAWAARYLKELISRGDVERFGKGVFGLVERSGSNGA